MEQYVLLQDLLIVFAVAGAAVFVFQYFRIPAVVGLLVAGMVVGPYGLSVVDNIERVELLADVGVVLLLFTIGLEFTRERLAGMGRLLIVGVLQVLLTTAGTAAVMVWRVDGWGQAIFAGFLVTHTSTTVLLKNLIDRGEATSPHARVGLAISIIQDISVAWMIVVAPLLAGREGDLSGLAGTLLRGVVVIGGVLVVARFALPWVIRQIVRLRSRELYLSSIIVVWLGTALLTAQTGFSLALGAFLAGISLAESEYSLQTLTEAIPFRDIFVSLFFISVGMLFNPAFLLGHPLEVVAGASAVIVLKFVTGAIPTLLLGFPLRVAVLVGLGVAQIGEFAFVLSRTGQELGLLPPEGYQTFLAASIFTIMLSSFVLNSGPRLSEWMERHSSLARLLAARERRQPEAPAPELRDHVIVAGYGLNGRNIVRVLKDIGLPHVVVEINPVVAQEGRRRGDPIYFGDCSRPAMLEHLRIRNARIFVTTITEPTATRVAVQAARRLNPHIHIIARTRYVAEVEELRKLGADEIIPEELETSVEIFSRVLSEYQVPRNLMLDLIDRVRRDHYEVLRHPSPMPSSSHLPLHLLSESDVESSLLREHSPAAGKTIGEMSVRALTGATVVAIRREGHLMTAPGPQFRFKPGDVVVLIGSREQVGRALELFDPGFARPDREPDASAEREGPQAS